MATLIVSLVRAPGSTADTAKALRRKTPAQITNRGARAAFWPDVTVI
jgi:hypothetical protein